MTARPSTSGLAVAVALAICDSSLSAQDNASRLDWPASEGGSGPFARSEAVRLLGELRWDVAVVSNGQVIVWWEPSAFAARTALPLGLSVNDVAALAAEQRAASDGRDRLVLAADEGLFLAGFDANGLFSQLLDDRLEWKSATRVHARDVNGDGLADLVALHSDRRTIAVKLQALDGTFADAPGLGATTASIASDIELAEIDGDGSAPEIAVDDETGLHLVTMAGVTLASHPSLRPDLDQITRMRGGGAAGAAERVLWSTAAYSDPSNATSAMFVVDASAATFHGTAPSFVGAIASGAVDSDDNADAVVLFGLEDEAAMHVAQPLAPSEFAFSAPPEAAIPLAEPGEGSALPAAALLADLDNDREADLFTPVASSSLALYASGPLTEGGGGGGSSQSSIGTPDFVHEATCHDPFGLSDGKIVFPKAYFPGVDAVASDPAWKLESRVYVRYSGQTDLEYTPTSVCSKPVSDYQVGPSMPDTLEIGFECPNHGSDAYFLYLRVVHVVNGEVVEASSPLLGAFTTNAVQLLDIDTLWIHPGWTTELVYSCASGSTDPRDGFGRLRRFPPSKPPPPPPPPPPPTCNDHTH